MMLPLATLLQAAPWLRAMPWLRVDKAVFKTWVTQHGTVALTLGTGVEFRKEKLVTTA